MKINPSKEVARLLLEVVPKSPFAGFAHAVGGFVRDSILGREPKDIDVVVEIQDGAYELSMHLGRMFQSATHAPRQLGASYPIWQLVFKDDVVHEGRTYEVKGAEVEFADTMRESYPDSSSRQRRVEFASLEDDIRRRDFTVNMLTIDLTTGRRRDLSQVGLFDLRHGILRHHPEVDPERMFRDDPLRLMRFVRFSCLNGFRPHDATASAARETASRISFVSAERVRDELIKIMEAGRLDVALVLMTSIGLTRSVLPEVEEMRDCSQPVEFHGEGDVFAHTLMTLSNAKHGVVPQLAALLHDVGKPMMWSVEDGKIHFYKHDLIGGKMAENILKRLKFPNEVVEDVSYLVKWHMRPHSLSGASKTALRRFLRETPEHLVGPLLDVSEADERGSIPDNQLIAKLRSRLSDVDLLKIPVSRKSILKGERIMELLGLKPGKAVGEAVQSLFDWEDEMAERGLPVDEESAERFLVERRK